MGGARGGGGQKDLYDTLLARSHCLQVLCLIVVIIGMRERGRGCGGVRETGIETMTGGEGGRERGTGTVTGTWIGIERERERGREGRVPPFPPPFPFK